MFGKTGADAIFKALSHICRVLGRYRLKLDTIINAAEAALVITSTQATTARNFLDASANFCLVWSLIAEFNDIDP